MSPSKKENEFASYVVELMQTIGPVCSKNMFGGQGIFLEDLMFGLVSDNTLYLKVDDKSIKIYKEKGLEAFTYNRNGKAIEMSYYQAPEEALENINEMNLWANMAFKAALTKRK